MLQELILKGRFSFHDEFDSWQEAIAAATAPLIDEGVCSDEYVTEIIECVKKHGPYIVIMPNIALPHAVEGAKGVYDTAISFMKVEKPVRFDPDDREKDVILFFVLASVNHEKHLENISGLSQLLSDESIIDKFMKAKNKCDLEQIANSFAP